MGNSCCGASIAGKEGGAAGVSVSSDLSPKQDKPRYIAFEENEDEGPGPLFQGAVGSKAEPPVVIRKQGAVGSKAEPPVVIRKQATIDVDNVETFEVLQDGEDFGEDLPVSEQLNGEEAQRIRLSPLLEDAEADAKEEDEEAEDDKMEEVAVEEKKDLASSRRTSSRKGTGFVTKDQIADKEEEEEEEAEGASLDGAAAIEGSAHDGGAPVEESRHAPGHAAVAAASTGNRRSGIGHAKNGASKKVACGCLGKR